MLRDSRKPVETLICYSRSDESFQIRLNLLLESEKRIGRILSVAVDQEDNQAELNEVIPFLKIALVLISPTFLEQKFTNSSQMYLLLDKHKRGKLRLIPVILHSVNWQNSPLSELQALPRDNRPIKMWPNEQKAWLDIIQGIRNIYEDLQDPILISNSSRQLSLFDEFKEGNPLNFHQLKDVFVRSGAPSVTFVEPEDFQFLKVAMSIPGSGLVIEGPSGAGKTTAWEKAIESLPPERLIRPVTVCDAREEQVRVKLRKLKEWHTGTVIIDDFHRLSPTLRGQISEYLKLLADKKPSAKKLVLVGIPHTGQTLVDNAFDLATRVDVFELGRVSDDLVRHMIEAGERALNIKFDQKGQIVNAANGSLYIAQFFCLYICSNNGVLETQEQLKVVPCNIDATVSYMMKKVLSRKFDKPIRQFAALGGRKNSTCLELLELLAYSENGTLSLDLLKDTNSNLKRSINTFIEKGWIYKLYRANPDITKFFYFNKSDHALIIDDPQLTFYLQRMHFADLAAELGKIVRQKKVFICYSHEDSKWLKRLQTHLSPIEREGVIELWDDTKITPGANWKEEIQKAIESAQVAVILVSPNLLASKFITEYELPTLLSCAEDEGTYIIQLVITPCFLYGSELQKYAKINPFKRDRDEIRTLTEMPKPEQDKIFVKLAETIETELRAYRSYY